MSVVSESKPTVTGTPTTLAALRDWVAEVAALTRPDTIHW